MIQTSHFFVLLLMGSAISTVQTMDNHHRINREAFMLEDSEAAQNYKKEKELARNKKTRQKKHQNPYAKKQHGFKRTNRK